MFRRLPFAVRVVGGHAEPRAARVRDPARTPASRPLYFYVVYWRPGFAPGHWERLIPAGDSQRAFRSRERAQAAAEAIAGFDGIVAVMAADGSSWKSCRSFKRPRAV